MIKANELRIGNWVYDFFKIPNQVKGWMFIQEIKDLNPILLTPEILEKCGFEKYSFDYLKNHVELTGDAKGKLFYFRNEWNSIEILHLHQLQNLYFALTGEELEVKL